MKPLIANSHTTISHMGHFTTELHEYAEESILKHCFNVDTTTHFAIPCGSGSTGAFERMHAILRIN